MSILFITGAGISAPSGIPTYRGDNDSLYNDEDHMNLMHIDSLNTTEGCIKVKEHMNKWKELISSKEPNEAHYLVTELVQQHGGIVLTQNVDDLHERSGLPSEDIFHLHGSLFGPYKEGFELEQIYDVVLFGDDVKDESVTQAYKMNDTEVTVLVGTSLNVYSPFYYIDPSKPIYIINKNPEEVKETLYTVLGDDINLDLHIIQKDVIEGLQEFKQIYK